MSASTKLLRMDEVSERTGIPVETLRSWRKHNQGPKSARLGGRVAYRERDVEEWINAQFDDDAQSA